MLVARNLARARRRNIDDEPLADVLLALSASTAGMIAILDVVAGRWPLTALACLGILVCHILRLRRVAIFAAALVWLRILGLSDANSLVVPLAMLVICAVLLIGPGRVLDWVEARWDAYNERLWLERQARLAAWAEAEGIETFGWIEDLSDPR